MQVRLDELADALQKLGRMSVQGKFKNGFSRPLNDGELFGNPPFQFLPDGRRNIMQRHWKFDG